MCGVAGIAAADGSLDLQDARRRVGAMLDALAHRGPDDVGLWPGPGAVLGATRLAIRGLADGRQPLIEPASGVVAVCNGEIDNHRELRRWLAARGRPVGSPTDVAVIPGLYAEVGEAFVERLVGAFAIALWDPRARRLLLARDRAGERPLFYQVDGPVVRFATELCALAGAASPLAPDGEALAGYLASGYFTAPATPFREVRKVGPAEVVTIEPAGVARRRYWRWGIGEAPAGRPSLEEGEAILAAAVGRQMDVDVECGLFLSGGVDSSLVAAMARRVAPDRRLGAYTLRFREGSFDEGDTARTVARTLGLESATVTVLPSDFPDALADLVRRVGEPLADPAWLPTALLARRAARDVKVVLVGEGADELFGGYPTYLGAQMAGRFAALPGPVRVALRALIDRWPVSERKVPVSYLLKRFVEGAELEGLRRHLLWTASIPPALLARLWSGPRPDAPGEPEGPLLDVLQRHDLEATLAEGLLTKADRASMNSALEVRAPYLDVAVMEFAATLPPADRVRGLTTKVFLKRLAERHLPRTVVHQRKRGLSVPLGAWLRGPLHDWAAERLGDPALRLLGIDPEVALGWLAEHRARRADHARALWTVVVLAEWWGWTRGAGFSTRERPETRVEPGPPAALPGSPPGR